MTNPAWLNIKIIAAVCAVIFLQSSQGFSASTECGDAVKNLDLSETFSLDSQSIDQKIQSLSELKLSLDLAKVNGTSSIERGAMKANYEIKEQELVEYLEQNKIMSREQLIERMKVTITELQKQNIADREENNRAKDEEASRKREQVELIKELTLDGYAAVFHKAHPGDFMMGEGKKQVSVKLTTMPEIMATPVTQIIYKMVAELANIRFPTRRRIDPDPSFYKGDTKPVEMVSFEDVEKWTQVLNELSEAEEPALQILIPGHKKGMRYSGFMTEAQREYLMKIAKTEDGDSIDEMIRRKDRTKLHEYAEYGSTKAAGTALVDETKPLFIDGKAFYGLNGNVCEWVIDRWNGRSRLKGGTNPIGIVGAKRVIRGSNWGDSAEALHSTYRNLHPPSAQFSRLGFRLVRTVE